MDSMQLSSACFFFFRSQSPQPLAKKHKKSNQPPSGLHSGWDSAIKQKFIAPANKSNTEDDDSLVQFGGMVGDDEDDEVEQSVIVTDKGLQQAPSDYVHTTLVHGNNNRMTNEFSHHL